MVTMESTLLYIVAAPVVEWLFAMQELSKKALLLAGRCGAVRPPLLVADGEAKSDTRVANSSSPSSTIRSSPNSDVCM